MKKWNVEWRKYDSERWHFSLYLIEPPWPWLTTTYENALELIKECFSLSFLMNHKTGTWKRQVPFFRSLIHSFRKSLNICVINPWGLNGKHGNMVYLQHGTWSPSWMPVFREVIRPSDIERWGLWKTKGLISCVKGEASA